MAIEEAKYVKIEGLIPATVTPFHEDGTIDGESLRQHIVRTVNVDGVFGVVVNGHAGEILALTSEERQQVISIAREVVPSTKKLFSGIEARTINGLVSEGKRAVAAGADGILVLPPFDVLPYRQLNKVPGAVLTIFEALDKEVGLPMIIFQYPESSGSAYSIPVLKQLSKLPNVIAVKAAASTITRYAEIWDELHDHLNVLAACDAPPLLGMLLHGAHGALIGISVIGTDSWSQTVHAAISGDAERARRLYNETCVPLMKSVFHNQEPDVITGHFANTKQALFELGELPLPVVRFPEISPSKEGQQDIRNSLSIAGLLREQSLS